MALKKVKEDLMRFFFFYWGRSVK